MMRHYLGEEVRQVGQTRVTLVEGGLATTLLVVDQLCQRYGEDLLPFAYFLMRHDISSRNPLPCKRLDRYWEYPQSQLDDDYLPS